MTTRNRRPALLEPYLQLPSELSLILLTGTLGCSPTWLTSLFVGNALSPKSTDGNPNLNPYEHAIVLASWMHDAEFWRSQNRRSMSIDVAKLEQQGRFVFVDCLSPPSSPTQGKEPLASTQRSINDALFKARGANGVRLPILILDAPELLLATATATAAQLVPFVLHLRSAAYATIISCSADLPLVSAASQFGNADALPIDYETAAFISQLSHGAYYTMSVRELRTGSAKDVSGVLRVTRGAAAYDLDGESEAALCDLETLYLVQRDGTAKVFPRGQVG